MGGASAPIARVVRSGRDLDRSWHRLGLANWLGSGEKGRGRFNSRNLHEPKSYAKDRPDRSSQQSDPQRNRKSSRHREQAETRSYTIMAVTVFTPDPESLVQAIRDAIADGRIETWSVDTDRDFTHSVPQWRNKAWMRPDCREDRVVFGILGQKNIAMSKTVYAVYHGRFIEMLLRHFDEEFTEVRASAGKTKNDNF